MKSQSTSNRENRRKKNETVHGTLIVTVATTRGWLGGYWERDVRELMSTESIWIIQDWGEVIESPAVELSDMCLCVGRNRIEKSKKKSPRFKTTKKNVRLCFPRLPSFATTIKLGTAELITVTWLFYHTHTQQGWIQKKKRWGKEREREKRRE